MPEDNIYRGEIIPEHLYDFLEEYGGKGTALKFLKDVHTKYSIYEDVHPRREWLKYALEGWGRFHYVLRDLPTDRLSKENKELWCKLAKEALKLNIKVEI